MKKIFTKTIGFVAAIILFVGIALSAHAQTYTKQVLEQTTAFYSAMTRDGNGNIYAIRCSDGTHAVVEKFLAGQTSFTPIFTGLLAGTGNENGGAMPWGLAVNSLGDVYITTNFSNGNTLNGGTSVGNTGNIIKLASNNGFNGTTYTPSVIQTGRYFTGLAFDSANNLYAIQMDAGFNNYTVTKYTSLAANAAGTQLFANLNDDANDNYPQNVAVASNLDIYVTNATRTTSHSTASALADGVDVRKYTSSSAYASFTDVSAGNFATALALDPSDNLYVSETDGSRFANYRLNKYTGGAGSPTQITTLDNNSGVTPMGVAAVSAGNIYVLDGGNPGAIWRFFGAPVTAATGVSFSNIATTTVTATWTSNGDGSNRAVFIKQASSGNPTPVNSTTYTANVNYGSGTQIGATGWYCIYNGSGSPSSINVTGLTQGQAYSVMVVEYNGAAGSENYLQTIGTNNPNTFTTQSPTTINSINRVTATPSKLTTVNFTAVFGSAVTGVAASNFSVTPVGVSGVSSASIGTPTSSDNITWTIPVSTGTGDGTIQLNLANATGLSKTISTSLPFNGTSAVYTIDKTAPAITISAPNVTIANSSTNITWSVSYVDASLNTSSIDVTGLFSNINKNGTATISGSINVTPGSGGNPTTVTFVNVTGNGSIGFTVPAGSASDNAGNVAPASSPSTLVTIDNIVPTVAISRSDPNPISASTIDFQAVFSEAVTGVDASDFTLTTTGGVTFVGGGLSQIDPKTYNLTFNSVTGTGTATLNLNGSGTGIIDAAGNAPAGFAGETYNIDQTAPTVASIVRVGTSPTNATSVDFTVTFSEAVNNVDISDFTAATNGTAGTVSGISGSGTTYTVTVSSISGDGTLGLNLNTSGTGITDLLGNAITTGFTGNKYTIDNMAPNASGASYASNNADPTIAKLGDVVTFQFSTDELVQTPVLTIAGHALTTIDLGSNMWSASYTVAAGDADGKQPFTLDITDIAGNHTSYSSAMTNVYMLFDQTKPTVNAGAPSQASIGTGTAGTVTYDVTYADANFAASALSTSDITLNTGGTANGTVGVTGSGTNYTVTISGITGIGSLGISIGGGTAVDRAGNIADGSAASTTFSVLSTDASLSSLSVTGGTLSPAFSSGTLTGYNVSVPNLTTSVTVTPTATDNNVTSIQVRINGGSFASVANGTSSGALALNLGANTVDIRITAQDGVAQQTYTITFNRLPSNNARLRLKLSPPSVLTLASGPNYADYTANVFNSISSVKVIPVADNSEATITVNGAPATSGVESAPITLHTDTTSIFVTATAGDGVTKKTYRILITHVESNDARLSKLTLSPPAVLTKVAGPDYVNYTANVFNEVSSIKLIPVLDDMAATVTVNGMPATSGVESAPVALHTDTTSIAVTVTAPDGMTKKTYRILITHVLSTNAMLTKLKLSPAAVLTRTTGPNYADYTATEVNSVSSVKVTPITADNTSTVTVNGVPATPNVESAPVALHSDTTSIAVTVTAADGATRKTYRVVITHVVSTNAMLAKLTMNPSMPLARVAGPDYLDYTTTVPYATSSVKVIPVTQDPDATLTVNSAPSTPGVESAPITLHADTTSIAITVTAGDGVTKNTYRIVVTRQPPPPAVMAYQPQDAPIINTELVVHQNVSPNGDGKSDAMLIEGITSYPDNKLQIMGRSGNLVYEAKGYDNTTKVFDGHANNGKLQQAGTYFYSLEYKVGSETKYKTGYIVLKY